MPPANPLHPRQSRFAMVAIVLLVFSLVVAVRVCFPPDQPTRSAFEEGLSKTLGKGIGLLVAHGVWIVACLLTLVAIARACLRRCRRHLVFVATMLCLLTPVAFGILANWPSTNALVAAAYAGDDTVVRWCLAMGVDINKPRIVKLGFGSASAPGKPAETPLTMAVEYRQPRMVTLLVQKGANVNLPDGKDLTPLERAVMINEPAMVQLLLNLGASVNPANLKRPPKASQFIQRELDHHAHDPQPNSHTETILQIRALLEKTTPTPTTSP